jgi:methyltransferase-like protein
VANRRHEVVRLPDLERALVPLLDGTRDRAALAAELGRAVAAGHLRLARADQPLTDPAEVRAALASVLDQALAHLARSALLIA